MCPAWSPKPSLRVTLPGKLGQEKASPQPVLSLMKTLLAILLAPVSGRAGLALLLEAAAPCHPPGRVLCLGAVPLPAPPPSGVLS